MKPEIKKKWTEALKSGEYKQSSGFLQNQNGFCCLGVLCDLYAKENRIIWKEELLGHRTVLPVEVMRWAGLDRNNPYIDLDRPYSLAGLNDLGEHSFSQIAAIIETQL